MAISEEALKRHNQQRQKIAQQLAISWNQSSEPNLANLTEEDFTSEILHRKFNRLYSILEALDAPSAATQLIVSTDPKDVAKLLNSHAGIPVEIKPTRFIAPIASKKEHAFVSPHVALCTLDENIEINYQKRALSFFHGAILATQYDPLLTNTQKIEAANKMVAIYNRFKDGPERNGWLENKYEVRWGRKQSYYLKKMLVRMSLTLEEYGLEYKDICAGEMIANLERDRPKEIISEIYIPFDDNKYICTASITEKPLTSQMNNHFLKAQYQFLNNNNGHQQTPDWFKKLQPLMQEYLFAHKDKPDLPAMPATLRGIPGLANMNLHTGHFTTTQAGAKFNVKHQVIRHGTLTPYDMDNAKERMDAARANGQALAEIVVREAKKNYHDFWADNVMMNPQGKLLPHRKIPIADMSLMSPIDVPFQVFPNEEDLSRRQLKNTGLLNVEHSVYEERYTLQSESNPILHFFQLKKTKDSNLAMKKENRDAYLFGMNNHPEASQFNIQQHNLGINGDRYQQSKGFLGSDYRTTTNATLDQFDLVKRFVATQDRPFRTKENENKFQFAVQAAEELKRIQAQFGKPYKQAETDTIKLSRRINTELFANGLYAIIIQGMGGTVSACCKSTKDRTGLFILHLDAMHQYYAETGTLIKFDAPENSPERRHFVDIMANLYLANTQQYAAGQATLGSAGIKKPGGGLGNMEPIPTDFLKALEAKSPGLFEKQKELANANKIKFHITLNPMKALKKMHHMGSWSQWYYEKMLFTIDKVIDRFKNWRNSPAPRPS